MDHPQRGTRSKRVRAGQFLTFEYSESLIGEEGFRVRKARTRGPYQAALRAAEERQLVDGQKDEVDGLLHGVRQFLDSGEKPQPLAEPGFIQRIFG